MSNEVWETVFTVIGSMASALIIAWFGLRQVLLKVRSDTEERLATANAQFKIAELEDRRQWADRMEKRLQQQERLLYEQQLTILKQEDRITKLQAELELQKERSARAESHVQRCEAELEEMRRLLSPTGNYSKTAQNY